MRALPRYASTAFALQLLLAVVATLALVHPAKAAGCPSAPIAFGRGDFCSYFNDHYQNTGHDVLTGPPPGFSQDPSAIGQNAIPVGTVKDGPSFVNFIWGRLNEDCNVVPVAPCRQDHVGAEFIILTMLGPDASGNWDRNKGDAKTRFNEWKKAVIGDDNLGMVTWDSTRFYACSELNTLYQGPVGGAYDDVAPYKPQPTTPDCNKTVHEIVFWTDSSHTKRAYEIKHDCANPIGEINAITRPPYHLEAALTPGSFPTPQFSTGPNNGIIQPGIQYWLTPAVWDPTSVDADPFYMEVENLNSAYVANAGILSSGGQDTGAAYRGSGCSSGVSPCWHWDYGNGLGANSTSTQTNGVSFRVSNATPQGTRVCFRLQVKPSDQNGATLDVPSATGSYCFLVYAPVYPSVTANNSDVHAGGGTCGTAPTPGTITGNLNGISKGEYVVSANTAAGINSFGSNNSTTSRVLDLGKTGQYASVCRQDLWGAAQNYIATGGYQHVSGDVDVGALSPAFDVFVAAGTIRLHGVVNRAITIVGDPTGNVEISGQLTIDTSKSYTTKTLPSLGIISHHDILIHSGDAYTGAPLTQVNAYMFADGVIDTCVENNTSCATPTLFINGFMMGSELKFRRRGAPLAKGATLSEQVSLNPQIYLNPPKLFDDSINNISLQGEGERRPLF